MTNEPSGFPDAAAGVAPLLAVLDLQRSLDFWVTRMGGRREVQWDDYARIRVGEGEVHLAATGDPPADRAVRLVPPGASRAWRGAG